MRGMSGLAHDILFSHEQFLSKQLRWPFSGCVAVTHFSGMVLQGSSNERQWGTYVLVNITVSPLGRKLHNAYIR
jgi:hypothetical protein